ncbi:hypothetical protein P691DRAFT_726395 [Macrolepiota fuliginosa MF-IS2]|uniref:BTB domain-containing protein n=1 Tax=Macrolepiota fuliginosa MF-IS2 TaxID=1400762 RepID=A0A9P5XFY5_9AGAR|nr:hypothetical protein P691DRAFT_726395 [Macrolepiota fuliginosa MF-IS2]
MDIGQLPGIATTETHVASGLQKHPIYWFDDGSLILHVQDVLFKVHYSLFQRHSPYLASASKTNITPNAILTLSDIRDPIPYVVFGSDRYVNPKDVEVLLEHMYHDFPLLPDSPFERISAVLRSSSPQQLDMPAMHSTAEQHFCAMFANKKSSDIDLDHLHEALSIARTLRLPSVLRIVLYQAMITFNLDLDDEAHSPESESKLLDSPSQISSRSAPNDMKLCKRLMARVIEHFTPILFTPATTPHMACTDVFADTWMNSVILPAIEDNGVYKPIETLERIKELAWAQHGLCASCVVEKREEWTEEQENVWQLVEKWLKEECVI